MAQPDPNAPKFPHPEAAFISTLRALLAERGHRQVAELLGLGGVTIDYRDYDNWNGGTDIWGITVRLPVAAYAKVEAREQAERIIQDHMAELLRDLPNDATGAAVISPIIGADLRAVPSGINNQGNVYSLNQPQHSCDNLRFRSKNEVRLYRALKGLAVTFAPLPAFIRGTWRAEPDFVLIRDGIVMVVEVDGPATHPEPAVDAERRLANLRDEGVHVERVYAVECDSDEAAKACADKLVAKFEKLARHR